MSGNPPQGAVPSATPAAAPRVLSSYRAPLGCPTQQEFIESVESRSATLRLVPESAAVDGSERVRVRIQPDTDSAGWVGELQIEGGEPLQREVRGERCQDVALALALIAVLRFDGREPESAVATGGEAPGAPPSALLSAVPSAVPSAPATASAVPPPAPAAPPAPATAAVSPALPPPEVPAVPVAPVAPVPAASAVVPEPSAAPAPPVVSPEASGVARAQAGAATAGAGALPDALLEAVPTERRARVEASAEPDAEASTEATPERARDLALSLAALVGYAAVPSHALEARLQARLELGPQFYDLSAALGVAYGASSERTEAADLSFRLITAQLELCPASRQWAGLWLQACGQFSAGVLHVSVSARDLALETEARTPPWLALGPSLHAGLPLAPHLSLRALAIGSLLLVRDSLDVERTVGGESGSLPVVTRSTLYRAPLLSFELLFGLGYAF